MDTLDTGVADRIDNTLALRESDRHGLLQHQMFPRTGGGFDHIRMREHRRQDCRDINIGGGQYLIGTGRLPCPGSRRSCRLALCVRVIDSYAAQAIQVIECLLMPPPNFATADNADPVCFHRHCLRSSGRVGWKSAGILANIMRLLLVIGLTHTIPPDRTSATQAKQAQCRVPQADSQPISRTISAFIAT